MAKLFEIGFAAVSDNSIVFAVKPGFCLADQGGFAQEGGDYAGGNLEFYAAHETGRNLVFVKGDDKCSLAVDVKVLILCYVVEAVCVRPAGAGDIVFSSAVFDLCGHLF